MKILQEESFLSYSVFVMDEVSSTNDYLKSNYPSFPDKTVLFALKQTKGRGRGSHIWKSGDDLCFSLLFHQRERSEILSPLALMNQLRAHSVKAFIKWPNDVYVDEKKIAGVLIEDIFYGSTFVSSIIGIGVNMEEKKEFSADGVLSHYQVNRYDFLKEFLSFYEETRRLPFSEAMNEYTRNNLVYNREIEFQKQLYRVTGFSKEGYLEVTDSLDRKREIKADEISIKESLRGLWICK